MTKANGNAPDLKQNFIPAEFYVAPDVLQREKQRLWPKVWQMACRIEEIPKIGDFVNYRIFDESILVTRTGKDTIQAFYNACQHRGRKLRVDERGKAQNWYCPFHGWRYKLNGAIEHVAERENWTDSGCPLNDADLSLKEVRVDTWAGWVWINQDPDCEELADWLGEVKHAIDPFEWERGRMAWYETIIAPVNWKVIAEAFNESYHPAATHISGTRKGGVTSVGAAHGRHGMFYNMPKQSASEPMEYRDPESGEWKTPKSAAEAIWASYRNLYLTLHAMVLDPLMAAAERIKDETELDGASLMPRMIELHKEELEKRGVDWPENLTMEAIQKAGVDWHIFPNSIVLPTADSALWYRIRPNGDDPDSAIFDIWCIGRYAPGKEPDVTRHETVGFDAFRGRNPFLEEDFANMEAVHDGMKSRGWHGARANPVQECQIVNFHRALQEYISD